MEPTKFSPVVWQPPVAPPRAREDAGNRPFPGMSLVDLPGPGPEDVIADDHGRLYTGLVDGRVVRLDPDAGSVEVLVDTGGRPLGLELGPDDDLLVCDSERGLLRLDLASRELEVLVDEVDGEALTFASNVVRASDGTLYFTSSTRRWDYDHWMSDILEHTGTGRLMRRAPDGRVEVLRDGLQFANGLALAEDESFLCFAQTGLYSVDRLWLEGPRAGEVEPVLENLPGFPDNMARGSDGLFWLAMAAPRNGMLDWMLPRAPWIRRVANALPEWMQPPPDRTVWVIAFDDAGEVVHDMQGPGDPRFARTTGVCERNGTLYLGSMEGHTVAVVAAPTR